jgi:hypothetical protein
VHFIDYYWEEFTPRLEYWDGEKVESYNIFDLNIKITGERECTGKEVDGQYIPCSDAAKVDKFEVCQECASPRIPDLRCIFEPSCKGGQHEADWCKEEHAVYIAFYRKQPKVGMTRRSRLPQRLIEQGADAYCVAAVVPNRYEARQLEKELSRHLHVPQRLGSKAILNAWARPKEKFGVHDVYKGIRKELKELEHDAPSLNFLDYYPLHEPLRKAPRLRELETLHRGKVVGVKGRYAIYEMNGLYAVDLRKLVSRFCFV